MSQQPQITVVTITRRRPDLLRRAICSVQRQRYAGPIHHLILIDDCGKTLDFLAMHSSASRGISYTYCTRSKGEMSGPTRLAKLRNRASDLTASTWMSFLDDDNEYEPEHVHSLVDVVQSTGADVAYSYSRIFTEEGVPFIEDYFPWARTPTLTRTRYIEYCRLGLLKKGSNIHKFKIPGSWPESRPAVDTNIFMFRASLLRSNPISGHFGSHEWNENIAEDDRMVEGFLRAGARFACSAQATVRYYLGGYSNCFASDTRRTEVWHPGR